LTQLLQGLLRKSFDAAQVGVVQVEDVQNMGCAVIAEVIKGGLGNRRVTRTDDEAVGLRLVEQLLDGFEALWRIISYSSRP
jgi:hypothetical protein